jgi:hypothetical protein
MDRAMAIGGLCSITSVRPKISLPQPLQMVRREKNDAGYMNVVIK